MDFSVLLTLVQIVSAIWVLVFGSKSVYDLVQSKSRQKAQREQGLKISPLVIVNVALAIGVLVLSTTLLFLLKPPSALIPYPPSGWRQVINDSMKNRQGDWAEQTEPDGSTCKFAQDGYHLTEVNTKGAYINLCTRHYTDFTDLAFEAQLVFIKGESGGIILRTSNTSRAFYYFWINRAGGYGFDLYDNSAHKLLKRGSHTAIHPDPYQSNSIAVVAQGNTFDLYVNGQLINTVTDEERSLGHGRIGLVANSTTTSPTEVVFSNIKVWEPSS